MKFKKTLSLLSVLIITVFMATAFLACKGDSPQETDSTEQAIKDSPIGKPIVYLEEFYNQNFENIEKIAFQEYWDYETDRYGNITNKSKRTEEIKERYMSREYYLSEYGNNYNVIIDITDIERLDDSECEQICNGVCERYSIPREEVTNACFLKCLIRFQGNKSEYEYDDGMYVVEVRNKWYNCTSDGGILYCFNG